MPSILIVHPDGRVLCQDCPASLEELVHQVREAGSPSEYAPDCEAVEPPAVIIIARQSPALNRKPPKLTAKQAQVLCCLASSLSPGQTALRMGLSEESVRNYIKILKRKFNTSSRDQLMAMAGYLRVCDPYQDEA